MRSLKSLRVAGFAALLAAGAASAADMPAPPPIPMAPPPAVLDAGGGFYLRGDVGMGLHNPDKIELRPAIANTTTLMGTLGDNAFVGIGAGYQFNSFLRADVTGEYRFASSFRILEQTTGPAPATPANPGYNIARGRLSAGVVMANAYVDLGTWHRITPYIGGGVGIAALTTSDVTDRGFGAFAGGFGRAADRTQYNFAWALHAGLSYDLSANLKADVGYRYLNMGTARSSNVVCSVPCTTYRAEIKGLDSHDLRIGLRYVFADTAVAPVYAPGPLVRKY